MKVPFNFNVLSNLLVIVCLWFPAAVTAQTPSEDWIWSCAGGGVDVQSAVYEAPVINSKNEVLVCGLFQGDVQRPMTFDSSTLEVFPAASMQKTAFLTKYLEDGSLAWAQSFRSGEVLKLLITVDWQDNIYLAGSAKDFLEVDTIHLLPSNVDDPFLFLIKLDAAGTLLWAKIISETQPSVDPTIINNLELKSMKADPNGEVVLLGNFTQDAVIIQDSSVAQIGFGDVFMTKLNPDGNLQWIKGIGGADCYDFAQELAIDLKGNCYISTTYQPSDVVIEPIKTIISRIDPLGNTLWTDTINPGPHSNGLAYLQLHVGPDNNLYTVATYKGSFSIQNHMLPLGNHLVMSKIDPDGQYDWVRTTGSTSVPDPAIFPAGIVCDREGGIYVTGTYVESLVGPVTDLVVDSIQLINQGGRDMFFLKCAVDGGMLKAENIGDLQDDGVGGLALDGEGNVYLSGYFNSRQLVFNTLTQWNPSINGNSWGTNYFIVKYGEGLPTGIDPAKTVPDLRVFPNPTRSVLQLRSNFTLEQVSITDLSGRNVYKQTLPEGNRVQQLQLDMLPAGLYMLKVWTAGGLAIQRIAIVK